MNEETIEQRKARLAALRNKAKGITNDNNTTTSDDIANITTVDDKTTTDNNTTNDIIKEELSKLSSEELNIVPQKVNWDLKNSINDKITKLKKRTQKAIVDILREKINQDNNDEQ